MAAALLGLAASLVRRQALDDPVAGKHAAIDREVPANHKGTHGCILLRQGVGLVLQISLVLPPIHQDEARVAIGIAVAFIRGVMPPTPPAEAFEILHVETAHCVNWFSVSPVCVV